MSVVHVEYRGFPFMVSQSEIVIAMEFADPDDPNLIATLRAVKERRHDLGLLVQVYDTGSNIILAQDQVIQIKRLLDPHYGFTLTDDLKSFAVALLVNNQLHEPEPQRDRSGFVYLLRTSTEHYKIGRTKNPENRLKSFGIKLPFEIEYLCIAPTDDMFALERELHQRFEKQRINGEWFYLTPKDVAYIKGLTHE